MLEHRYVMEQKIGRTLSKNEHVHHKKEKFNNASDNLELWFCAHPRGKRIFDVMEELMLQPEIALMTTELRTGIETAISRLFGKL